MRKRTGIGISLLVGFFAAAYFLYSYFVGFEKESLAKKLPRDTYASLSVRHLRKLGLAFATDDQLQASVQVIQAIGKILEKPIPSFDLAGQKPEIDEALLLSLSQHFKTQLTLAALPLENAPKQSVAFALLSDFYGLPETFSETLQEIGRQAASTSGTEIRWENRKWQGIAYQVLSPSLSTIDPELPPIQLSWAIYDETLYLCSHTQTLEKLLAHATSQTPNSALDLLEKHQIVKHVESADITLLLNVRPTLDRLAENLKAKLIASGGLTASFSPQTFVKELKLDNLESIALAIEFTGSRSAYSGVTYNSEIPLLDSLSPLPRAPHTPPENTAIFAFEELGFDTGKGIITLKDAFLKAAPLAIFPYFGLRSSIKMDSGLDLESALPSAFDTSVTSLQTIDIGTGKNEFGEIQDQVVWDQAFTFKLKDGNSLKAILDSQMPKLLSLSSMRTYQEDGIVYFDGYDDTTLTSKQMALSYDSNYITFGSGTLKSFHTLLDQANGPVQATDTNGPSPYQVGSGSLTARKLPATLFQLAAILYQQVNNTPNIPTAFTDFEWSSLSILEQNRQSTTYKTDGHLYRVSKQID